MLITLKYTTSTFVSILHLCIYSIVEAEILSKNIISLKSWGAYYSHRQYLTYKIAVQAFQIWHFTGTIQWPTYRITVQCLDIPVRTIIFFNVEWTIHILQGAVRLVILYRVCPDIIFKLYNNTNHFVKAMFYLLINGQKAM